MKNMIFLACRQMPLGCQSVNACFPLSLQREVAKQLHSSCKNACRLARMALSSCVMRPFAVENAVVRIQEDGIWRRQRPSFMVQKAVFCTVECRLLRCGWRPMVVGMVQVADCQGVMWNVVKSVKIGGLQSVARCLALRARPGSVKRIIRKVRVSLPCAVFPTLCHICHDAVRSQIFHFSLPVIH